MIKVVEVMLCIKSFGDSGASNVCLLIQADVSDGQMR